MPKCFIYLWRLEIYKGENREIERESHKWKECQSCSKKDPPNGYPSAMEDVKGDQDAKKKERKNQELCRYSNVIGDFCTSLCIRPRASCNLKNTTKEMPTEDIRSSPERQPSHDRKCYPHQKTPSQHRLLPHRLHRSGLRIHRISEGKAQSAHPTQPNSSSPHSSPA